MQKQQKTALVWYRNDLRAYDHEGLNHALTNHEKVIAFYAFDLRQYQTTQWGFKKTEKFRAQFLIETINDLTQSLKKLNVTLIVTLKKPEVALPEFYQKMPFDTIYLQEEWTSEELKVVENVKNNLPESIKWQSFYGQFLFHPEDLKIEIEKLPEVFTVFRKNCEKNCRIRTPLPPPQAHPETNLLEHQTQIPKLEDLGLDSFKKDTRTAFPFLGGATAALKRLNYYFWDAQKLSFYKNTRNGLLGNDYSSKFSPWLAVGALSPRHIAEEIKLYEKQITKNQSTYWLLFELIWRDYFKYISIKHENKIFKRDGILERQYDWKTSPKLFLQWTDGTTPEPFVNANMLELKHTGWMSNRGRQNVGSFLAKELHIDWRMGAAYFESMLIDYDVHSNYGNWLYVSGVGNDPRDRKFNIKSQAERYDAQGTFQLKWLQTTLFS